MRSPRRVPGALRAVVDYRLVHAPRAEHLAAIPPHRLSLMINDNKDGTHGFRFLGANEFKNEASFTGDELQHLIEITRGGLRLAAWGDDNPWTTQAYRYGGAADDARLRTDLVRFAIRGYRFYDAVVNRLAGGVTKAEELAALMVKPGLVQIALKESARHVLPAALIYDQPGFNTNADPARYRLCPEFLAARARPEPLDQLGCFTKGCPHRDEETVVCPSGFWGYRHSLGLPVTVAAAPDAPTSIAAKGAPGLAVAVSTDPNLTERRAHEETLKALRVGLGWGYGDTLERTIALLKTTTAQVVYFYCHGGVTATHIPYLQVGALTDDAMTRDVLRAKKIRWATSRPLVFINGCHTTALEPEIALDFVSAFVENAYAGGVIGTEITVFEPLARGFAEDFLRRFLDGVPVGEAVRATRLQMLKDGNPLGLAYIPFVLPSLNLVAA